MAPPPSDNDSNGLVARARAGDNAEPLSITEISNALKRTVEDRFGHVRVRGELSGVKRAASGHLYCALKDEKAVLDGVMWRGSTNRLAFVPEDGLEVIATGKHTTYAGRSKYQIVMARCWRCSKRRACGWRPKGCSRASESALYLSFRARSASSPRQPDRLSAISSTALPNAFRATSSSGPCWCRGRARRSRSRARSEAFRSFPAMDRCDVLTS